MKTITFLFCGFIVMMAACRGYAQTISERTQTVHQQIDEKHVMDETLSFQGELRNTSGRDIGTAPGWNWVTQFGGDGKDFGYDIATDINGNIYVVGSFAGAITIGSNTYTSSGFRDMFVAKIDKDGTILWWRQSTVAQYHICEALSIALDNTNKIYITGYFDAETLVIGTNTLSRIGTEDFFIANYDNNGNPLWARNTGIPNQSFRSRKIAVDDLGNSYIITAHDVLKYSADGQLRWDQYYPTTTFFDIAARNNYFYLTGYFFTEVTFGTITLQGASSSYFFPFAAKGTSTGDYSWAVKAESNRSYNRGDALAVDADENVYIAGSFRRQLIFGSTVIKTSTVTYTPYIAKYDKYGVFQWVQSAFYDSYVINTQRQTDICLDLNNDPYIIGFYSDGCALGSSNLTGEGYFITKYSAVGSFQWLKTQEYSISDTKISAQGKLYQIAGYDGNIVLNQNDLNANKIWSLSSDGNSDPSEIAGLERDPSGNIYSLGYTMVANAFSGNVKGVFVSKHNSARELQWNNQIIGSDLFGSYGDPLFLDASGNVYVCGTFSDTLKVENTTLVVTGGDNNIFLAKFNNAGILQWARQITGSLFSDVTIIADQQGNVILCAPFSDSVTIGNSNFTTWGYGDVFLAKYNPSGNVLWAKHIGGTDMEYCGFVSVDAGNNIYLTGEFLSRQLNFTGLSMTLNESDGDVILAKYSPDGIPQWAHDYGDGDSTEYARMNCWPSAIETDAIGNSYIYGWTGSQNYYGSYFLESPYSYNFFLTKIDNTGQVLWAKIIKEKQYGWQSMQIDLDAAGNCYIGGNTRDTVYFENYLYVNQGLSDLFIAKYNTQGTFRWCKTVGSSINTGTYANIYGIAACDTNSVYTGGRFTYNYNFDNTLLSASGQNGFIALLGNPVSAINEISKTSASISPNPSDGIFYIKSGDNSNLPINIEIYNSLGQIIQISDFLLSEPIVKIDLTNYPKGIYFIRIQGPGYTRVEKMILR
jgi:hypothetical protein